MKQTKEGLIRRIVGMVMGFGYFAFLFMMHNPANQQTPTWWVIAFVAGMFTFMPIGAVSFVNLMEGGSLEDEGIGREEQVRFMKYHI